ncbi:hypothetical protein [Pararhizobium sp. A13]|uniref:hypothetical protein n=1 Tax=Pararhizobium sp. A13 TaxID=3133975 RepID=UPI00311AE36D
MTSIYYETLLVAHLTFVEEWRLNCDPSWEARSSAFPVSLTMPLRSGPVRGKTLALARQPADDAGKLALLLFGEGARLDFVDNR